MQYKISERNMSELFTNIYLLQKGVRDCCLIGISLFGDKDKRKEELFDIEQYIIGSNFEYYIIGYDDEDDEDLDFSETISIYIFKYNHQRLVIELIENKFKEHSFMYEYLRGTLLGYSAEEMEKYLMKMMTDIVIDFKKSKGGEENVLKSEPTSEV